jgi:hypothetical protein
MCAKDELLGEVEITTRILPASDDLRAEITVWQSFYVLDGEEVGYSNSRLQASNVGPESWKLARCLTQHRCRVASESGVAESGDQSLMTATRTPQPAASPSALRKTTI